ncbi:MAG TPA: peptidoglycan-binding protein [Candidatus Dormibacteraeota bacterium]|nr:peptidoglycan-binding protein [Candidatus Dormibacteraeota bacterium]
MRCWPIQICTDMHTVAPGGRLRFRGRNLKKRGMIVIFKRRASSAGGGKRAALTAKLRHRAPAGFIATVPTTAKTGRIRILGPRGERSNVVGPIHVVKRQTFSAPRGTGTAFDGTGMWIWYVSKSGGSAPAIAAQAQQYGVKTVFVKSSDGTTWWDQFSPDLVSGLKAAGIHVCAWQFVYGKSPTTEASLGARAAQTGADCLVIDAEGQYEGLYSQAQTYIENLRSLIGQDYPLGLAGFPYVDYHPSFPYSVFLGPGGAQYNAPQVYWKAIGTSVDTALAHTYMWNTVYERPIFPLGQLYDSPPTSDIQRFRALSTGYGAPGVSWWSWQSASTAGWGAIAPPDPAPIVPTPPGLPLLKSGSKGDVVVWAQQHLISAGQAVNTSGAYDSATATAVSSFQSSHFLPVTGQIDASTWQALLQLEPAPVAWNARKSRSARASSAGRRNGPRSAFIRTRHYEIPRTPPAP